MSMLKSAPALPVNPSRVGLRAHSEFPPVSNGGDAVGKLKGSKPVMKRGWSTNDGAKLPSEVSRLRTMLNGGAGEIEEKLDAVAEFPIPEYADFIKGMQLRTAGVHVLVDTTSPGLRSHLPKEAIKGRKKVWGILWKSKTLNNNGNDPWNVGRNSHKQVRLLPAPELCSRNEFMSIRESSLESMKSEGKDDFDYWRSNPNKAFRRSSTHKKKASGFGAMLDSLDSWQPSVNKGCWHSISAQTKDIDETGKVIKLPSVVVGLTIQSRHSSAGPEHVKKVQVFCSDDGKSYEPVDGGKLFDTGCKACNDEKCDIFFEKPVFTKIIRIKPVLYGESIAMRSALIISHTLTSKARSERQRHVSSVAIAWASKTPNYLLQHRIAAMAHAKEIESKPIEMTYAQTAVAIRQGRKRKVQSDKVSVPSSSSSFLHFGKALNDNDDGEWTYTSPLVWFDCVVRKANNITTFKFEPDFKLEFTMELLKSTAQQRANIILCTTGGGSSGLLQIDFWPSTGNLCIDISEGGKSSQIKTPFSLQKEKMYTITIVMKGSKFSVTAKKVGDGGGSWEKSHSGVGMVPRKAYENVKLYASSPSDEAAEVKLSYLSFKKVIKSEVIVGFEDEKKTETKYIEDSQGPAAAHHDLFCNGPQWTKEDNGWGVNTSLPSEPILRTGFISGVRIKHKGKRKHNLQVIVMERVSGNKFKCIATQKVSEYEANALEVRDIVISPPLLVKKGQFVGVNGSQQLDVCSDSSVKKVLYYGSSLIDGGKEVNLSKWNGSVSIGFKFSTAIGEKTDKADKDRHDIAFRRIKKMVEGQEEKRRTEAAFRDTTLSCLSEYIELAPTLYNAVLCKASGNVIRSYLRIGWPVNELHPQFGESPLSAAARIGHTEAVQVLLAYGAEPDGGLASNAGGFKNHALQTYSGDSVFDDKAPTPIELAARHGHTAVVKALLCAGVKTGRSLALARDFENDAVIDLLIQEQREKEEAEKFAASALKEASKQKGSPITIRAPGFACVGENKVHSKVKAQVYPGPNSWTKLSLIPCGGERTFIVRSDRSGKVLVALPLHTNVSQKTKLPGLAVTKNLAFAPQVCGPFTYAPLKGTKGTTAVSTTDEDPLGPADDDEEDDVDTSKLQWSCNQCTFINPPTSTQCDICAVGQKQDGTPVLKKSKKERKKIARHNSLVAEKHREQKEKEKEQKFCNSESAAGAAKKDLSATEASVVGSTLLCVGFVKPEQLGGSSKGGSGVATTAASALWTLQPSSETSKSLALRSMSQRWMLSAQVLTPADHQAEIKGATDFQRVYRGFVGRTEGAEIAEIHMREKKTAAMITIQSWWRKVLWCKDSARSLGIQRLRTMLGGAHVPTALGNKILRHVIVQGGIQEALRILETTMLPLLHHLYVIHSVDLLTAGMLREYQIGTLSGKSEKVEQLLLSGTRESAQRRRTGIVERRTKRMEEKRRAYLELPETSELRHALDWSNRQAKMHAAFKVKLDDVVGLDMVKNYVADTYADAVGRYALFESLLFRNVLLMGTLGTGKRTSAEIIGYLGKMIGSIHPGCGGKIEMQKCTKRGCSAFPVNIETIDRRPYAKCPHCATQVAIPADMYDRYKEASSDTCDISTLDSHLVEINDLEDLYQDGAYVIPRNHAFYWRVGSGPFKPQRPSNAFDGALITALQAKGSIVIVGGEEDLLKKLEALDALNRQEPVILRLPILGTSELAQITALQISNHGYRLCRSNTTMEMSRSFDLNERDTVNKEVMEHIVRQRYDDAVIATRNAHLAKDMVDLAIKRKNKRVQEIEEEQRKARAEMRSGVVSEADLAEEESKRGDGVAVTSTGAGSSEKRRAMGETVSAFRLVLTPADFDVKMLSQEEKDAKRQEIDDEIDAMSGWGNADQEGSPKWFFSRAKQWLLVNEKEKEEDTDADQKRCWNMVVTGNPGTGKTTFGRLVHRFLVAYGALEDGDFIECNGLDLKGAHVGETAPKVQTMFREARNGTLFVDEAYSLIGENRRSDQFAKDAIRACLTEIENNKYSTLTVFAGYKDKVNRLLREDPGLPSRFPFRIHINDYTPMELTTIARDYASSQGYEFEDGLFDKLIKHIDDMGKDPSGGQARMAVSLAEDAIARRGERIFQAFEKNVKTETGQILLSDDFNIGAKLGDATLIAQIDNEVNDLIGMDEAKLWFKNLKQMIKLVDKTGDKSPLKVCLNMVLTGNPGTGKTTFARLLVRFLVAHGILSKDNMVERNGLELKGEYVGETAPKVKEAIAEAMGGCLFIDEAYSLAGSAADDDGVGSADLFSKEAVRTLLTEVENNRTGVMVIMAGYKGPMQRFFRLDPGLDRRFQGRMHLNDYTPHQLARIAKLRAKGFGKVFEDGLVEKLAQHISDFYHREIEQQNGGLSLNLTEEALRRQSVRLVQSKDFADAGVDEIRKLAVTLTAADYGIDTGGPRLGKNDDIKEAVMNELDSLVGMETVKEFFQSMRKKVEYIEMGGSMDTLKTSLNMIITGNPGTGKTTVARLIFRFLNAYGILPVKRFVEKNGLELKGRFVGQTAPTVKAAVKDAMGGALFIDEAYALVTQKDNFSMEVVRMLLTEVENNRTNLLVMLAGYRDKMSLLIDSDPGMARRFGTTLHLPDYTPIEIAEICKRISEKKFGFTFADGLRESLAEHIGTAYASEISQQNGGLAVNLVEAAVARLSERYVSMVEEAQEAGDRAKEDELRDAIKGSNQVLVGADFGIIEPKPVPHVEAFTADKSSNNGGDGAYGKSLRTVSPGAVGLSGHEKDSGRMKAAAERARRRMRVKKLTPEEKLLHSLKGFVEVAIKEAVDKEIAKQMEAGPFNDLGGFGGGGSFGGGPSGDSNDPNRGPKNKSKMKMKYRTRHQEEDKVSYNTNEKKRKKEKEEVKEEEKPAEKEEVEDLSAEEIQAAIGALGQCGAGYGWIPCEELTSICGVCKDPSTKGQDGYCCSARVDFLCWPCIMDGHAQA